MQRLLITIFLGSGALTAVVTAQTRIESALTNQLVPYSSTIAIPQPNVPTVTVPQPNRIEIPSVTTPFTNRVSARPPLPPNIFAPSSDALAHRNLQTLPPTLPPPVPLATTLPAPVATEATSNRVYFVDMNGSDNNPGTTQSPWRTLQHAANLALPGDTVVVRSGTYEAFHTVRAGEKLRPITFRAQGLVTIIPVGGGATSDLQITSPEDLYRLDNILVRNTDYIVIDGFTVRYAGRAGISVLDSRGVVVQNNVCGPNGLWGIFTGFAVEVQIISNKTFSSKQQHGIYVSNSRVPDDNPVVQGNESWDNGASGIQLNGDCNCGGDGMIDGALVEGNIIHDNDYKGFSLISIRSGRIQNNLIYNNGRRGGAGGIHLTDELGCGHGSSSNTVVNNTIVEPRIAGIRITDAARQNIIFNNLIVSPQPIRDEVGDNWIDDASNATRDSAAGIFQAPSSGNYRLLPGSPASGKGKPTYQGQNAPVVDLERNPRRTALTLDAGAY